MFINHCSNYHPIKYDITYNNPNITPSKNNPNITLSTKQYQAYKVL